MKTAAMYIRVSTDDQTEYSPDAQKRLLIDFAKKNDMLVSNEHVFIEEGISGRKADARPQFQKMVGLAKSKDHPFDVILVWKFSRFARNQEESIVYKSLLKKNNVDVISVSEPIIDGPFGSLIERIIEWMDEYYSIRLSEEVKRGMIEKAMRGEYQTTAPLGYILKDGKLIIDYETEPIIKKIFDLYLSGGNFFSIAQTLNNMGLKTKKGNNFENRTVSYIIQNPVYKGYVRWNPEYKANFRYRKKISDKLIVKKGTHQPIISEVIWDQANEKLLKEYKPRHRKPNTIMTHWLGGLLICSNCNSTLSRSGNAAGYQCTAYSKGRCNESHYVSYKKIEKAVIGSIKELSESGNFEYEILQIKSSKNNDDILRDSLKKLDIKSKRIYEAYVSEVDTLKEYKANKERIAKERADLENQLCKNKEIEKSKKLDAIMLKNIKNVYDTITSDSDYITKNNAIKSVVKKIIYDKKTEHIKIVLYYS